MNRFAILSVLVLMVVGCYNASSYSGDGTLTDNGYSSAIDRYVLDLEAVEIGSQYENQYRLKGLPSEEFTIGLRIRSGEPIEIVKDSGMLTGSFELELVRDSGEVVISEIGDLSEWVWSYCSGCTDGFIYRRGEQAEERLASGGIHLRKIGERIDAGWGTYITPDPEQTYLLTVRLNAESSMPISAAVTAKTGGWK